MTQKTLELQENGIFDSLKAKREIKQRQNNKQKTKHTQNKANIKQKKHKTQKQRTKATHCQKWKQVGFDKGDVSKVCFKETRKH